MLIVATLVIWMALVVIAGFFKGSRTEDFFYGLLGIWVVAMPVIWIYWAITVILEYV